MAYKIIASQCTVCGASFGFRELLQRPGNLIRFQSGSICHRACSDRRYCWTCRRFADVAGLCNCHADIVAREGLPCQ